MALSRRLCASRLWTHGVAAWLWATTVHSALFTAEREAFAQQVGAGPTKQVVLVLDGAGWADWA